MYKTIKLEFSKVMEKINSIKTNDVFLNNRRNDYDICIHTYGIKCIEIEDLLNTLINNYVTEIFMKDNREYYVDKHNIAKLDYLSSIPIIYMNNSIYFRLLDNPLKDQSYEEKLANTKKYYSNCVKNNFNTEVNRIRKMVASIFEDILNNIITDYNSKTRSNIKYNEENVNNTSPVETMINIPIKEIESMINIVEEENIDVFEYFTRSSEVYTSLKIYANKGNDSNNKELVYKISTYNYLLELLSNGICVSNKIAINNINKEKFKNLDVEKNNEILLSDNYHLEFSRIERYNKYIKKIYHYNNIAQPNSGNIYYVTNDTYNTKPIENICSCLYKNNRVYNKDIVIIDFNYIINASVNLLSLLYRSLIGRTIVLKNIKEYNLKKLETVKNSAFFTRENDNEGEYSIKNFIENLCTNINSNVFFILDNVNIKYFKSIIDTKNTIIISDFYNNLSLEKIKALLTIESTNYKPPKDISFSELIDIVIEKLKNHNSYDINKAKELLRDTFYDKIIELHGSNPYDEMQLANKKNNSHNSLSVFDNYIGLDNMKDKVLKIIATCTIDTEKRCSGIGDSKESMNMHMVFKGNPGTAKTTMARIIAEVLYKEGVIYNSKILEVGRADLVGAYVGHTAIKTKEVIDKGRGGVIFIDEAYSLNNDNSGGFGKECINTLVEQMELVKNNTIFIFAGYPKEMDNFISSNPGIKSRIGFELVFDNYNKQQLLEIAEKIASNHSLNLDKECMKYISDIIDDNINREDFGNGRFIRAIIEDIRREQSYRLYKENDNLKSITLESLKEVKVEDVQKTKENFSNNYTNETRTLGFINS